MANPLLPNWASAWLAVLPIRSQIEIDPLAPLKVIEGLAAHVKEQGLASIRDVIGVALPAREED